MALKLTDIPELVMNRILDRLDYKSIQPLGKECHYLRNFIDDQNPNPKIDSILIECKEDTGDYRILYDNSGIGLNPETWTSVYYEKYKNGCLVRYKDKEIVLENEDFLNRSMEDLEMVVRSKNATVRFLRLDQLPLDCGQVEPIKIPKSNEKGNFSLILDSLKKKVLEPRIHKLKVHRLLIETNDQKEIMKVLPFLDSEFLKELRIFNTANDENKMVEMDEILKLDHLNNFERFEVSGCIIPDNLVTKLSHIPYCHIQVKSVNSKDLLFLKEVILRLPTFEEFEIKFQNFPDLNEFLEATGTWKTKVTFSPEKFEKSSYFQTEEPDSILMITYSTLYGNQISFEKKTLRWVTSGGPIIIQ
ncbi:hypothetical protein L5515_009453 [Caenorhabditis briggsae]|uniref:F-box domain-containing protein n=1 Tax=Caenorhabditis briggsae TaxID=6238 RepID=A0AAE9FCW5_CAEBR|nr:hypothetical protein L5515_009453 [Caenorhabditis briggsae]